MKAALAPAEIVMMRSVFRRYPALTEVRLFGSRAKGNHTSRSDIDFALFGNVTPLVGQAIASDLDDLPLPYKYDVQVFSSIQAATLRDHIQRVGIPVYPELAPQFIPLESGESVENIETSFRELLAGRIDFWKTMNVTSSRGLRALITLGLSDANGSYKGLAMLFHVSIDDYGEFMDFLRRSDCLIDCVPFRHTQTHEF